MTATQRAVADEQARAKAAVDALDTNKDGTVSPEEYRAAQLAQFTKQDVNGDGKLTADELAGARGGRGGAPSAPSQIDGDTNKDGALSQAEFIANVDKEYKTIDKDWNNKITVIEMTAKVRNESAAPAAGRGGGGGGGGGRGGR
ncbi:MAG: transaldolase/EF-hand protein [Caulobacteraceae bacterium]|nr:transaldolase/EF-hand protein [Caulobacteraceae bacterium]